MDIKEKSKQIKSNISAVYIALKDERTHLYAKIVAGVTVGYALSQIDIVPDFIPVLGYLDDVIILLFLILLSMKLIPKNIMEESKEKAKNIWKDGKPKKWYYAIPIVIQWILIIYLIIKAIFIK